MIQISSTAVSTWGGAIVFLNVLLTRLGVPLPAIPILLFAGSAIAGGALSFWTICIAAVVGAMLGDCTWFITGRVVGRRVLTTLGRLAPQVDAHLQTARALFERFGVPLVAVCKFVPGLAFITPPLMGTTGVDWRIYVAWDAVGTAAWASFWLLGGAAARDQLRMTVELVRAHGGTLIDLLIIVCVVYLAYRALRRWQLGRGAPTAPLLGTDVDRSLRAAAAALVIDGRPSHARTVGSGWNAHAMPLDLESAGDVDKALAAHHGVVYCVCPNEAIASQVGARMRSSGFTHVRSRKGDVDAWRRRGYPVEAMTPVGETVRGIRQPRRDEAASGSVGADASAGVATSEPPCKPVTLRGVTPTRAAQPRRSSATG